jgi:hypothetical protein
VASQVLKSLGRVAPKIQAKMSSREAAKAPGIADAKGEIHGIQLSGFAKTQSNSALACLNPFLDGHGWLCHAGQAWERFDDVEILVRS